ncbi:response regulator transcription factor [Rhodococcoides fascians]|uniref:response regulator transcription factor n=1 Tax=Rhodococcoides fascians TaxID=1828 RepID=UPI00055C21D8|nr:response regulator transcription factor [Rhodococcus fascians]
MNESRNAGAARVLVVEDSDTIGMSVVAALEHDGHIALRRPDGSDLESTLTQFAPDLVILDIMLPGRSGIELLPTIKSKCDAAVLLLTARDAVADRVDGLRGGADDYLVKPFDMAELLARAVALLRRLGRTPSTIRSGDVLIDSEAGSASRAGVDLQLTSTEWRLLTYLARQRGRTVSKVQILTQVWGYENYDPNLVEVHISSLRKKLELHGPRVIGTVRGIGYVLLS